MPLDIRGLGNYIIMNKKIWGHSTNNMLTSRFDRNYMINDMMNDSLCILVTKQ